MIRNIGIALFIFGLITVLIGAFYKLFLYDRKRSLLIPKHNNKKSSENEFIQFAKSLIGLDINLQVWFGIILIGIVIVLLLIILFVKYFMPEYFMTNFMTDVGSLVDNLFRL